MGPTNDDKTGEGTPKDSEAVRSDPRDSESTPEAQQTDPETFDRAYVEKLRGEAAEHRTRAKRAEAAEARLRDLAVADAVRGILTDSTDLGWSDDYLDDDGWPDADKITAAAEELVARKPHLGRPSGDVGQGRHSDSEATVSLGELLRAGA